jgi:hypothetical protein
MLIEVLPQKTRFEAAKQLATEILLIIKVQL